MKRLKHSRPERDSGGRFGGRLNLAIVGILVAATALLVTVIGFWQHAQNRCRAADREIIKLERQVSESHLTIKGLGAALDEHEVVPAGVVTDAAVHAIQFYVTDWGGGVLPGATVFGPRTKEQVTSRDTGLTDKLNLRVGDKVLLRKEGYEPIEVMIDDECFKSRLVAITLRRKDNAD